MVIILCYRTNGSMVLDMINTNDEFFYSAPGRVCFFGEHQDHLKLTVIPSAIDLRTTISLRMNNQDTIRIKSLALDKSHEFTLTNNLQLGNNEFDYIRAILMVLYQDKIVDKIPGYDLQISSTVPIGSGLSSSAALLVAWLIALNDQLDLNLSNKEIADYAFKAENQILKINCGIMDQYSSAIGGIFSLDCDGPPYHIISFDPDFKSLVIGDSQVKRAANKPLTLLKEQIDSGLAKINRQESFSLKTMTVENLDSYKQQITHDEYKRLFGVLKIRDITKQAASELAKTKNQNLELLGNLLTKQHHMLSKNLQVSIEKLDVLVNESIQAGALGAKLTGAGLGGCMVAFAPGKELDVAKAIEKAGGKATICEIDFDGAKKD